MTELVIQANMQDAVQPSLERNINFDMRSNKIPSMICIRTLKYLLEGCVFALLAALQTFFCLCVCVSFFVNATTTMLVKTGIIFLK